MNPDDLIKAAPAIAKVAAPVAAAIPLTPIIKAILGDAAAELGQRFGDRVRLYRYGRSLDMLKKAEKMAQDAGYTPKAVPIKLLFPLLEGASFEEDEDLHTMWAALLANAAAPGSDGSVMPGFIPIIRHMSSHEARLLTWIYDRSFGPEDNRTFYEPIGLNILTIQESEGPPEDGTEPESYARMYLSLDGLMAAQLVAKTYWQEPPSDGLYSTQVGSMPITHTYLLTHRGHAFVEACRPPKSKT